jgi:hypothetical protein
MIKKDYPHPNRAYARYIWLHKTAVLRECIKFPGMTMRGILHDLSKLGPPEWPQYRDSFYGGPWPEHSMGRIAPGQQPGPLVRTKAEVRRDYNYAWHHHQRINDHHWQYWLLRFDDGGEEALLPPREATIEMYCDWIGAGKAMCALLGKPWTIRETRDWYRRTQKNRVLHPLAQDAVERLLVNGA